MLNHVGFLVRAGDSMLLFDPNYGLGLFQITDKQPLTFRNLTDAIMGLAWTSGLLTYYLSTTSAVAVIDEDALEFGLSGDLMEKSKRLGEEARQFFRV